MINDKKYFLPYQTRWLADDGKIKIWEKSRRIGATYVQSYEDVRDCVKRTVPAVWFSSADDSAAREYIEYCRKWTKLFDVAARDIEEVVLKDPEKDIKTYVIEFANGAKITAMSSNPKRFRSKGGKVVLDEFAHHDNQDLLWKAAKPCITWGYPLRILSTHNGQSTLFYKFIERIKKESLSWNLHATPIQTAVEEGLVDKIYGRKTTKAERDEWLAREREDCGDEMTWLQEYECFAIDEATAFLSYEMIENCSIDNVLLDDLNDIKGDLYIGMDIARKRHLSVIWGVERLGLGLYTRIYHVIEKARFQTQREILYGYLRHPNFRRACIDATGIGMNLAEDAEFDFGKSRVEPVTFTNRCKEEMATNLKIKMEDRALFLPRDDKVRDDFHSIRKINLAGNNVRFDADASDKLGHADRFWAGALAVRAAATASEMTFIHSRKRRKIRQDIEKY